MYTCMLGEKLSRGERFAIFANFGRVRQSLNLVRFIPCKMNFKGQLDENWNRFA